MTCPRCKYPECRQAQVKAVLLRCVNSRETDTVLRRFVERNEPGKVPVDPDAEQLASDVVGEMERAG